MNHNQSQQTVNTQPMEEEEYPIHQEQSPTCTDSVVSPMEAEHTTNAMTDTDAALENGSSSRVTTENLAPNDQEMPPLVPATELETSNAEAEEEEDESGARPRVIIEDLEPEDEMPPLEPLDGAEVETLNVEEDEEDEDDDEEAADPDSYTPVFTLHVTYQVPTSAATNSPPASTSDPESSATAAGDTATQPREQTQHIEIVFVMSPFNDARALAAARAAADSARAQGTAASSDPSATSTNAPRTPSIPPETLLRLLLGSGILGGRQGGTMPAGTFNPFGGMPSSAFNLEDFMNRAFLQYQQGVRSAPPSKQAMSSLNEYVVAADAATDNCTICQEDFVTGDQATKLPCSHAYHSDCVMQWLKDHHTCPVCRHALPTVDDTTVVH